MKLSIPKLLASGASAAVVAALAFSSPSEAVVIVAYGELVVIEPKNFELDADGVGVIRANAAGNYEFAVVYVTYSLRSSRIAATVHDGTNNSGRLVVGVSPLAVSSEALGVEVKSDAFKPGDPVNGTICIDADSTRDDPESCPAGQELYPAPILEVDRDTVLGLFSGLAPLVGTVRGEHIVGGGAGDRTDGNSYYNPASAAGASNPVLGAALGRTATPLRFE